MNDTYTIIITIALVAIALVEVSAICLRIYEKLTMYSVKKKMVAIDREHLTNMFEKSRDGWNERMDSEIKDMQDLKSGLIEELTRKHKEWSNKVLADVSDLMDQKKIQINKEVFEVIIEYERNRDLPANIEVGTKIGTEESSICNRDGCKGVLTISPESGCSCNVSPPCSACVDAPLRCPDCGWEEGNE